MFEGDQEIFVELLLLATGLVLEGLALGDGVVLLGVARGDLLAINAAFENFHSRRIFGGDFGQGNQLLGQVGDEGGLDEGGLDQLLEDRCGDFEVLVAYGDVSLRSSTARRRRSSGDTMNQSSPAFSRTKSL